MDLTVIISVLIIETRYVSGLGTLYLYVRAKEGIDDGGRELTMARVRRPVQGGGSSSSTTPTTRHRRSGAAITRSRDTSATCAWGGRGKHGRFERFGFPAVGTRGSTSVGSPYQDFNKYRRAELHTIPVNTWSPSHPGKHFVQLGMMLDKQEWPDEVQF